MRSLLIILWAAGIVLCGCTAKTPSTSNDPEGYLKPENSRVPFKLTDSYSFPENESSPTMVDDVDARDPEKNMTPGTTK